MSGQLNCPNCNDLISRHRLEVAYIEYTYEQHKKGVPMSVPDHILEMIRNQPAVDAVEVVRCEDCRYCDGKFIRSNGETILRCWLWEKNLYSNGYCAWGQRREEEHNAAD